MNEDNTQVKIYSVVVHKIDISLIYTFDSPLKCYEYFNKLIDRYSNRFGDKDATGSSLQHCLQFGFYQITKYEYIQMYESTLNEGDDIEKVINNY